MRLFFGLEAPEDRPLETRQTYHQTAVFIALPFTMVFVVVNFFGGFPGLALVEAFSLLFLVSGYFVAQESERITLAENLTMAYGIIITLGLLLFGGIAGSGILWIYAFPFLAFMLKGQRVGWRLILVWLVVMSFSLHINFLQTSLHSYSAEFKPQLTLSMIFYSLIAAAFNLERSRYEKLLQERVEAANSEAEFRSHFLSNVSHEIRTPLNAIYNLAEFAEASKDSSRQQELLHKLKSASKRLLLLLNNVLDFSKLENRNAIVEHAVFDLWDEIDTLKDTHISSTEKKDIQLNINIDDSVPRLVISDALKLHQIITNLLSNAIKFTPQGGKISLDIQLKALKDQKASLLFKLSDTGIGMTEAQSKVIFDSFRQADASTTRRFGGTGLGLAITRELVHLLDGEIWVVSEAGLGSEFNVALTMETAPEKLKMAMGSQNLLEDDHQEALIFNYPVRILVAEDDPLNRFILQEMLDIQNVTFEMCNNGLDALQLLKKDSGFDIILMDFEMPDMDGLETTRRIKQDPYLQTIPVMGLTANIAPERLQAGKVAGMVDTLTKPVIKADLYYLILQHVKQPMGGATEDTEPELKLIDSDLEKNPRLLNNLLEIFIDQYDGFENRSQSLLSEGDFNTLQREFHSLKGHLAYFKKHTMANIAGQLEEACSTQPEKVEELLDQLTASLKPFIEKLKQKAHKS